MSPDVSVIMPAFQPRGDWLREAVRSALDERDCEIELIVLDDGSDPPVGPLLGDVGDARLRIMRLEHVGVYAARNAGIEAAGGRYLRFLDADDIAVAGSTGRLLARAEREAGTIAHGATLMCDEALRPLREVGSRLEGRVAEICARGGFDVYVVSMLFPREVVERTGPWDPGFRVSGDWDFVLRGLEHAPVSRLAEVVTLYRRHPASVTRTADVAAGAEAGRRVLGRYFARHPELRGGELERQAYLRLHLDRATAHAKLRQPAGAARELMAAARRSPREATGAAARLGGRAITTLSRRWTGRR
jgi:glycosyltransferase involved in cell wall biosynthesis